MGQFYLQPSSDPNTTFELSATTSISLSQGASVTSFPVQDGSDASDNVVLSPRTVTFKGILSDVVQSGYVPLRASKQRTQGSNAQFVEDYIKELQTYIDNKELFTVFATDRVDSLRNCVITSFNISKDNNLGNNSWNVDIQLQQVRSATQAEVVFVVDADFSALLAAKTTSEQTSTDPTCKQKEYVNQGNVDRTQADLKRLAEAGANIQFKCLDEKKDK